MAEEIWSSKNKRYSQNRSFEGLYATYKNIKFPREAIIRMHSLAPGGTLSGEWLRSIWQSDQVYRRKLCNNLSSVLGLFFHSLILDRKARLDAGSMAKIFLSTEKLVLLLFGFTLTVVTSQTVQHCWFFKDERGLYV